MCMLPHSIGFLFIDRVFEFYEPVDLIFLSQLDYMATVHINILKISASHSMLFLLCALDYNTGTFEFSLDMNVWSDCIWTCVWISSLQWMTTDIFLTQAYLLKSFPLRFYVNFLAFTGISLSTSLDWTNVRVSPQRSCFSILKIICIYVCNFLLLKLLGFSRAEEILMLLFLVNLI